MKNVCVNFTTNILKGYIGNLRQGEENAEFGRDRTGGKRKRKTEISSSTFVGFLKRNMFSCLIVY